MKALFVIFTIFYCSSCVGQPDTWVKMPVELNDRVNELYVYNDSLIAGGFFTKADSMQVNHIAAWDGHNWSALGKGVYGGYHPFISQIIGFKDELYVVGNFDSAGGIASNDIAKWNGQEWMALGVGSNERIFTIVEYNDEIYGAGTFDSIGGIAARYVAKWDGHQWYRVGEEFKGYNVNVLYEYKNELYAIGPFDSVGQIACNEVAKWDGLQWKFDLRVRGRTFRKQGLRKCTAMGWQ